MRNCIVLIIILAAIDQASKRIAEANLQFAEITPLIPMLNLRLVYNEGAAFSFLSQAGGWQRWFFVALAIGVCAYLFHWLRSLKSSERILAVSLSLIISGAIGNLIDRALFGKVTDFIDFHYQANDCFYFFFRLPHGGCHWPTFNFADIFISIGALLMVTQIFNDSSHNESDRN